ncbi:hypothetical protein BRC93_04850 [Halobacteriales archaeon QS_5_70_15]|nr:MAG: hypothetical protein BRC93_04850 [Halobacteriales archaeon QS_5_70_15]
MTLEVEQRRALLHERTEFLAFERQEARLPLEERCHVVELGVRVEFGEFLPVLAVLPEVLPVVVHVRRPAGAGENPVRPRHLLARMSDSGARPPWRWRWVTVDGPDDPDVVLAVAERRDADPAAVERELRAVGERFDVDGVCLAPTGT